MPDGPIAENLLDVLPRRDGQPALLDPVSGLVLSHRGLHAEIASVAGQFAALGVGPADRVALVLPNGAELVVTFLAIASLGAAVAPLNPGLSAAEIGAETEDLGTGMIMFGPGTADRIRLAAAGRARRLTMSADGHVSVEGAPASAPGVGVAGAGGGRADPDSVVLLLHTSGTTSKPKTVPLRQRHLAHSIRTVAATYRLGPEDVSYCVMPLFHVHGLVAATFAALAAGGTVVVPPRFSASAFWEDVRRHRATWYTAVPTIHQIVLAAYESGEGQAGRGARGHGLRFARSCSSMLPPSLWRRFEAVVGVPLAEAYGMTEAAHQMAANPLPPGDRRPGSVGLATGVKVAILDKQWRPVPAGQSGEVSVRGASVVEEYLDNPEATAASFRDGWFRTGDLGTLSAGGYLTLTGRIKEMINRGGEKISPYEVEEVLLEHPAVAEAAVYGQPDEKYGEVVAAVVVARPGVTPAVTQEDLIAYCGQHLSAFKLPVAVSILPAIPKGPTGKIQRRLLASLVGS